MLAYIGPGGYFGEIGLMSHVPELQELAPPGVRVATCTALDHADECDAVVLATGPA